MKDVGVMSVARAARIEPLRHDALDFAEQLIQQTRIAMPMHRLLIPTSKLRVEHGSLPFTQAVVRSINVMAIEPLARHAAAVVHGAGEVLDFIIIGDDCPAFARSHQLAGLKTKCACNAERAHATSAPLAAVRVRTVFDQRNTMPRRNFAQTINVSRMPAQMYGHNGLVASSDRRFN